MHWWNWTRAQETLATWVRTLIGEKPWSLEFRPGAGSFVNFTTRTLVVDPTAPTAWGGVRLLPRLWRGTRVDVLPNLEWRCARALARHESAHILFTTPLALGGAWHWMINALEDGRIERMLGAMYPWTWPDFLELG